jgi:PAS domain S-box-containing protein
MNRFLKENFYKIKNPLGITFLSYLMVCLVAFFDFITNPEFSFSLFYLIPITFNAWYLNRKSGFLISFACAFAWLYVDVISSPQYSSFIAPYWNSAIRLGFFLIVVFLLTEIKYLYLNLEKLIKERTNSLTEEINKKNAAESELRRSKNLYQDLVENINEVYFTTDENGYFKYISPNFFKSAHLKEDSLKSLTFYDLLHANDAKRIRDFYKAKLSGGSTDATCEFRLDENNSRWFEQNSRIIYNNGSPSEIRNLLRDISERKAAERSLIKSEIKFKRLFSDDESIPAVMDFNDNAHSDPANIIRSLAERIDDTTETISSRIKHTLSFSSLASHELRTPLAIIRNQLEENLRTDTTVDELKSTTASIYDEVLRLQRIISDLLKLSKMEAGKFKLQKEVVELSTLINHFYEEVKLLAEEKEIEVVLCSIPLTQIEIDSAYFRQMLFNIFDNSLKYTRQNGRIIIDLSVDEDFCNISFQDTGKGMSNDVIENLFRPFYQNDSDINSQGTGLGLLLSKWIIELHDGTIQIESAPDKGTKVIISLPKYTSG